MTIISSRHNELFQQFHSLTTTRGRKRLGLFLVEGARLVGELLSCGESKGSMKLKVAWVVCTPEFAETERGQQALKLAQETGTSVAYFTRGLLKQISQSVTPPEVMAVVHQPPVEESLARLNLPLKARVVVLVLDMVQDPTNLGAVVRVAEATNCAAVLCTKGTADKYSQKVIRASMGSVLRVPVITLKEDQLINWLCAHEFQSVATVVEGGINCFKVDYLDRVALLLGNEARGLSPNLLEFADIRVTIPMMGKVQSLNIATAAAVLLYQISNIKYQ